MRRRLWAEGQPAGAETISKGTVPLGSCTERTGARPVPLASLHPLISAASLGEPNQRGLLTVPHQPPPGPTSGHSEGDSIWRGPGA